MADGVNYCLIGGHLGGEPELRFTQSGQAVLSLSVACNESYLDRNRVRQEKVEWVKCVVWGKRAEALAKFMHKGDKVFIEGKMSTSSWTDRENIKRYKTEVVAEKVFLGGSNNPRGNSKRRDPERERPNRRDEEDSDAPAGGGGGYDGSDYGSGNQDDDIPFLLSTPAESESWWNWTRRS